MIIRITRQDLITKTCIQAGKRKKWKSAPFLRPGKGVKKFTRAVFRKQTNIFFSPDVNYGDIDAAAPESK